MTEPITTDDVTIDRRTTPWGSPDLRITFRHSRVDPNTTHDRDRTIWLRSTQGMPPMDADVGFVVNEIVDGNEDLAPWIGGFDTTDPDQAITATIEYLNDMRIRNHVGWQVGPQLDDLCEALNAFQEALSDDRGAGHRAQWDKVRHAMAALTMAAHKAYGPVTQ